MTHDEIIKYSLGKKGAYIDYPFGPESVAVKVKALSQEKGAIFVLAFFLRGEPKVTLRCTPQSAEFFRSIYAGSVVCGYHCPPVQQPHFNTVSLDGSIPNGEILRMIDHSYEVVIAKMPKKIQNEIHDIP